MVGFSRKVLLASLCGALFFGCGSVSDFIDDNNDDDNDKPTVANISVPEKMYEQTVTTVSALVADTNTSGLRYLWEATEGSFSSANSLESNYTSPAVDVDQDVIISFTSCRDNKCSDKYSRTVTILSNDTTNTAPEIQSISINDKVLSQGSETEVSAIVIDKEQDTIYYTWSAKYGSFVTPNEATSTYIAPSVSEDTQDVITLSVSDTKESNSQSVFVQITVGDVPIVQSISISERIEESTSTSANALVTGGTDFTYLWSAQYGTFTNQDQLSATYTAPAYKISTYDTVEFKACNNDGICSSQTKSISVVSQ